MTAGVGSLYECRHCGFGKSAHTGRNRYCVDRDNKFSPKSSEPVELANPCIHTPSRCNGGGYDGCACGKYKDA